MYVSVYADMYTHIVYIYVHFLNVCDNLDKTLEDIDLEKQVMFHALEQMEQDFIAYIVLAV